MKLTSTKTLPVLLSLFESFSFTQTSIHEATGVSLGRINAILKWLIDKEIVIKMTGTYELTQPNRLAELIATELSLKKQQSFYIDLPKKEALELVRQTKAQLCSFSLAGAFKKELDTPEIHAFGNEKLTAKLKTIPRGEHKLNLYEPNNLSSEETFTSLVIQFSILGQTKLLEKQILTKWKTLQ
ncbi:MAG: hypothetical protein H6502_00995 [Candidatus Woesearchaeota archaeon]|nr:MAG: hypothetical protein H6502_00995 [Candidatus Woesearchaeota archaeon]